jgi:hypothetical protein
MILEELEKQYLECVNKNITSTALVISRLEPPAGDTIK